MTDEQKEAPIEKLQTGCRSCIFAEYEDILQQGCSLGRLDTFLQQGRATRSDAENYYTIDGICNASRGKEWGLRNANVNLVATVEREIQITMDFVLYSVDEEYYTLVRRVEKSVNSCLKQVHIKPKSILIVVKNSASVFKTLYDALQSLIEPYNIPFKLIRVVEDEANIGRCLEMGIDKCNSQFVGVFDLDHPISTNLIYNLNQMINYDLARMVMIEPMNGYSGLVLSTNIFKLLGKNYNIPIYEKVQEVAEEQNKEYMILQWGNLWNQK